MEMMIRDLVVIRTASEEDLESAGVSIGVAAEAYQQSVQYGVSKALPTLDLTFC